jgi:hypothetical protein
MRKAVVIAARYKSGRQYGMNKVGQDPNAARGTQILGLLLLVEYLHQGQQAFLPGHAK